MADLATITLLKAWKPYKKGAVLEVDVKRAKALVDSDIAIMGKPKKGAKKSKKTQMRVSEKDED